MTDHAAEGQQGERMRGLARESALRTQVAELKDSLAAALGRAARAEHKVFELTETCAGLRARLPRGKR